MAAEGDRPLHHRSLDYHKLIAVDSPFGPSLLLLLQAQDF